MMSDYELDCGCRIDSFEQWLEKCPENIATVDYPKSRYNGRSFWTSVHITTDTSLDKNLGEE
tara:strand:+ start:2858 stop:3043 length:186 start_codon:yes stop_codon:yes gene_type:complete